MCIWVETKIRVMASEGHSKDFRDVENPPEKNSNPSKMGSNLIVKSGCNIARIFIGELIGTALVLFLGCSGGLDWGNGTHPFLTAITFGLTVGLLVHSFGHLTGAHFNPAVTIAAVLLKIISAPMAIIYFVAQLIGATVGFTLLQQLIPPNIMSQSLRDGGFCLTTVQSDLDPTKGVIFEFIATSVLILLCCATWDYRNNKWQDGIAMKFGFAITLLSFTIGPMTGCSMNPARTFGPAFGSNNFDNHWIYWIGPLSAGIVIPLFYQAIYLSDRNHLTSDSVSLNNY